MQAVVEALETAQTIKGVPAVIVAHTVKGRGVSFMENNPVWHGKAPNAEQTEQALTEIRGGLK